MNETSDAPSAPEFLERFLLEAASWLEVASVDDRAAAIQLSEHPLETIAGPAMVSALRSALEGPWWQQTLPTRGKNWAWRDAVPSHETTSEEVVLERTLAARSPQRWTCQMATCSGLRPGRVEGRRAIDLVQRMGDDAYRFIELKVGHKHPLHAAFEILGYGLLYLLARKHGRQGTGRYDVMKARRIHLVVLAPEGWYHYKRPRAAPMPRFELGWLARCISAGLASEAQAMGIAGLEEMRLEFRAFNATGSVEGDCLDIERQLASGPSHPH